MKVYYVGLTPPMLQCLVDLIMVDTYALSKVSLVGDMNFEMECVIIIEILGCDKRFLTEYRRTHQTIRIGFFGPKEYMDTPEAQTFIKSIQPAFCLTNGMSTNEMRAALNTANVTMKRPPLS